MRAPQDEEIVTHHPARWQASFDLPFTCLVLD
jgi:hypothetical protein